MKKKFICNKTKNKKAMSAVVTTVLMIALVFALVSVVWVVIANLVDEKLDDAQSCFGNFDKITLNGMYTCYNETSGEMKFSIDIKDIEVEKVIVSISTEGTSKSFEIKNTMQSLIGLYNYSGGNQTILPEKNAGLTYIVNMSEAEMSSSPDSIHIAPVINGKQCDVSDSILEISDC